MELVAVGQFATTHQLRTAPSFPGAASIAERGRPPLVDVTGHPEMSPLSHAVIDGLRRTLVASRSAAPFIMEMEDRIRQLVADMVDGRVLPKQEAADIRESMLDLVRVEAVRKFVDRNPNDALRILDKLKADGYGPQRIVSSV